MAVAKKRKRRKATWDLKEGVRVLKDVGNRARKRGLSPRHRQVINEFFKNGYDKEAALRKAGYAENVCKNAKGTVFDRTDVNEEIQRRHKARERRVEVTVDEIVKELAVMAFAVPGKILLRLREHKWDLSCLSDDELKVIDELSEEDFTIGRGEKAVAGKKFKAKIAKDKKAALVDLGKHLGMFEEKKTDTLQLSIADLLAAGRQRVAKAKTE